MKMSLFFVAFAFGMGLLNFYIYLRFFKKLHSPFNRVAFLIPSILMLGEVVFVIEAITHNLVHSSSLYYLLALSIGITFLLFVIALFYDLNITLFKKVPYQVNRRKFIKLVFDVTMLILAISYLFKGLKGGLSKPILNTINVKVEGFTKEAYTIIQLSDVHVGRTLKKAFVEDLVKRTNAENPDIVVLTGDLIDQEISKIKEDLAPLQNINAPTFFTLGNHEFFHNVDEILPHIKSLGITVLINENLEIKKNDFSFNLVGLSDEMGSRLGHLPIKVKKAYKDINPELPTIVLAHQPKTLLRLNQQPCDLMLSGHTHGGQIFPFGILVMVDQPYLAGLYQHNNKQQIFVSRGAGYWGPPIRVLAPPEISKIVIRGS